MAASIGDRCPASDGAGDGRPSLRHHIPQQLIDLSECRACHLPAVTNPCTSCRATAHNAMKRLWPEKAAKSLGSSERSETNEADLAAFLDDAQSDVYGGPRFNPNKPRPYPAHGCAGEHCGTWGCLHVP